MKCLDKMFRFKIYELNKKFHLEDRWSISDGCPKEEFLLRIMQLMLDGESGSH